MNDPRRLAAQLLGKTFKNNSYSNISLSKGLDSSELSKRDKKLCSALYYGVIERRITLDYIISGFSKRPVEKIDAVVADILRCGLYQLIYMDSVPDNAAVNESVALVKKMGKSSASGFVNAVLRGFIRSGKKLVIPKNSIDSASAVYSAPQWLIESLKNGYGEENMIDLLSDSLKRPPVFVRFNNVKADETEIISQLESLEPLKSTDAPDGCFELKNGDVTSLEAFRNGLFHVQDKASQLCCAALDPQSGDTVLDLCAAPGGKTFTMSELMNGKGQIYAFDLHEKRVSLITEGAKRLGLHNIKAMTGDASVFNSELPKVDKILCDVPCSGLGVIRRKPEIKYKDPEEFSSLPEIQYKIAENALNYLKVGGVMVYSTCTLRHEENDEVIEKLLKNHPEIQPETFLENFGEPFGSFKASIFPRFFNSDGFFISKIRKVR